MAVSLALLVIPSTCARAQATIDAAGLSVNPRLIADSAVLPTDVITLPAARRSSRLDRFNFTLYQKLPPRFYYNASVETSFRLETNPFQFPTKRKLLAQFPPPALQPFLSVDQLEAQNAAIAQASAESVGFRVVPNIVAGWALAPNTRAYCNYFMLRDQLFRHPTLNTVVQSIGGGLQHSFMLTPKLELQADGQFRELYSSHSEPFFDFLPGLTLSYSVTPTLYTYVNALLQLRGDRFFQAPTKEIDPFYTVGLIYQRGLWAFSSSWVLNQNFREPFRRNATIPLDSYSIIADFEVSRRLPGHLSALQAFIRAEPIYNFHTNNTPGLSGMDFRLYWGLRAAFGKAALIGEVQNLRKQLQESEGR
ncbi:MAG TPA: hypothetical protein V6D08_16765 [Candidatus Obscuribacterales bacterium]